MRCKDVEPILDDAREDSLSQSVQEHLSGCSTCQGRWNDRRLLRVGFSALAEDPVPDATLGFATRVVRRLKSTADTSGAAAEFVERIGRRFVLASLLLTLSLLLLFALPSSGPLRGPGSDESYLVQSEANPPSEASFLADEFVDTHDSTSPNSTQRSSQK